jgi:hypothetical protein
MPNVATAGAKDPVVRDHDIAPSRVKSTLYSASYSYIEREQRGWRFRSTVSIPLKLSLIACFLHGLRVAIRVYNVQQ